MVYLHQIFHQHGLQHAYLLEGYFGILQLPVIHLHSDYTVDEFSDTLLRIILQGPRRGLNGIGEHEDYLLLRLRFESMVLEKSGLRRVATAAEIHIIKIFRLRRPVVRQDKIYDYLRNLRLFRKGNTVVHMLDDIPRALLRSKPFMVIYTRSGILHKTLWIDRLPYVMVQRTRPHKLHVGPYGTGAGIRNVHDLKHVLE